MIRKGQIRDIDRIMQITSACAKHMISKEIFQWNEHYPNRDAFLRDVENDELYILEIEDGIIGTIVISDIKDQEYNDVVWLTKEGRHAYIHRLAIHPNFQGKGYAKRLMDFAEKKISSKNYDSIRLDTFSQNRRNHKFYESRGYKKLGNIFFPKQSDHPFYCYELIL